jgi:hypothetical protein
MSDCATVVDTSSARITVPVEATVVGKSSGRVAMVPVDSTRVVCCAVRTEPM